MYLVAMHLPSDRRVMKSLPKYIEEYLAGAEDIRLVRGYFYNKLRRLNEKARTLATKHGVRVDPSWYLMSELSLKKFLRDLELLKTEYEEYEKMLNDFLFHGKIPRIDDDRVMLYPEYTEKVKEYLIQNKVEIKPVKVAEGVVVNVLPLQLSPDVIEKVADERLKKEVQKTVDEMARMIEEDVQRKLEELEKKLRNAKSVMHLPHVREALNEEIEDLRQTCETYNIEMPKTLEYRINRFYMDLEKKALGAIKSERARALAKKLLEKQTLTPQ